MNDQARLAGQFYPWQNVHREKLVAQHASGRLGHALLLHGMEGTGKTEFALAFAGFLLCEAGDDHACGSCKACGLLKANSHPDRKYITLDESRQLKIDQFRELISWSEQTASRGGNKVAIIQPADAMNLAAANALLKCLEEPPNNTYFFLVTNHPARLIPTVRSRCQAIQFGIPDRELALTWLECEGRPREQAALFLRLACGAPLSVLSSFDADYLQRRQFIIDSVIRIAQGLASAITTAAELTEKDHPFEVYEVLCSMLADALKIALGADLDGVRNQDNIEAVRALADSLNQRQISVIFEQILAARNLLLGVNNPQPQLVLESVLVGFAANGKRIDRL